MDTPNAPFRAATSLESAGPLLIPAQMHKDMVAHCLREAPLEACGLLGGVGRDVMSFHPLRNLSASAVHYQADPQDLIRAVQDLRSRNAEIVAIYHSHPHHAAIPSQTDIRENYYGDVPRIIVSLLINPPEVRVWRLNAKTYDEIPWRQVADEPAPSPKPVRTSSEP